ncbi:hypothetical protein AB9P05_21910 [Roseivirga sp. BDSF3-8]|uniref:hypothetical protein n=1 Tax=Roseivirga sp. BDSF3-8 TaxID=3241598 RepID=UPI0035322B78
MIKRTLLHYGFLIPALLFLIHQLLQRVLGIALPFADAYLDPFCMGALAPYLLITERTYLFGEGKLLWLDLSLLYVTLVAVSEIIFPFLSDRFYTDWWDALAILLGIIWYRITAGKFIDHTGT